MARFAEFARLAEDLSGEASRLKKRAAIAAALIRVVGEAGAVQEPVERAHAVADAGLFCLYLAGQPFAEADPRKLNAGGALLTRVLKQVSGCTDAALTAAYRRHGDLGAAAYDLLVAPYGGAPAEGALSLDEIADAVDAMAGARSAAARASAVEGLLRRATALEAKYLLKLMLGDMRIGVKQSLIEEAIAAAASQPMSRKRDMGHPDSVAVRDAGHTVSVAEIRHAVMLEADLARVVRMAFVGSLAEARMRLFHPLGFMLASPVETPEEAIERFTEKPEKLQPTRISERKKRREFPGPPKSEAALALDMAEQAYAEDVERTADQSESSPVQAFLEDKYDGMRAQLHCGDPDQPGRVAIYSRNREDITQSFPEIEEAFRGAAAAGAGPLILDGELLGWDFAFGHAGIGEAALGEAVRGEASAARALPFSVLGQRIGRKRVDNEMRRRIPVVFMAFDLLFQDGELLLPLPLRERRARLEAVIERLRALTTAPLEKAAEPKAQARLFESFDEEVVAASPLSRDRDIGRPDSPGTPAAGLPDSSAPVQRLQQPIQRLLLSPAVLVESAAAGVSAGATAIARAYAAARARANEGVMLKAAASPYLPGRRGLAWLKLKRELATLDVVITGAEFGHGRRAGLLSDYTFAVREAGSGDNPGRLLNVGKAYSGVTDAEIAELTGWLNAHTLEDRGHFRTVEPLRVIEVAFNNIMRSERHASGFALRFPRILRLRDDKPVEEIDTLERVEQIYQAQPDKPGGDKTITSPRQPPEI